MTAIDAEHRGDVGTTDDADGGLFGSDTGANMAVAAAAEVIGTFLLIFCGTASPSPPGSRSPPPAGPTTPLPSHSASG